MRRRVRSALGRLLPRAPRPKLTVGWAAACLPDTGHSQRVGRVANCLRSPPSVGWGSTPEGWEGAPGAAGRNSSAGQSGGEGSQHAVQVGPHLAGRNPLDVHARWADRRRVARRDRSRPCCATSRPLPPRAAVTAAPAKARSRAASWPAAVHRPGAGSDLAAAWRELCRSWRQRLPRRRAAPPPRSAVPLPMRAWGGKKGPLGVVGCRWDSGRKRTLHPTHRWPRGALDGFRGASGRS
jgi:hypothetical protein